MNQLYDILKTVKYRSRSLARNKIIGNNGSSCCLGYNKMMTIHTGYTFTTLKQYDTYINLIKWAKDNLPPDFEFNFIYCNKNTKAIKHKDSKNVGNSFFVYTGDCIGGDLNIYDEDDKTVIKTVKKNELHMFNGYENYHETQSFTGERYSVIFSKNYYYDEQKKLDDYVICIPSHNRADICNTKTLKTLHDMGIDKDRIFVFTDKTERKEYTNILDKKLYNRVVNGKKGICEQREYIKSIYPEGYHILYLDDDIAEIDLSLSLEFFGYSLHEFIITAFKECEETGVNLWGVYPVYNKWFRIQRQERRTTLSFIIGAFYGIINRNDEDLKYKIANKHNGNKEDVEYSIMNYIKDGKILRYDRIGFKTKIYNSIGGLGTFTERLKHMENSTDELKLIYNNYGNKKVRKNGMCEFVLKKI